MRTRILTVLTALVVAASLALGSTVSAQDDETEPQQGEQGTGMTDTATVSEEATDLWLLSSQETVTRLDGETGEVVAQLDVAAEGCYWQRMVGPSDGAIWLLMDRWDEEDLLVRAIDATRFCIGRFPVDGSAPEVFSTEPSADVFDVEDVIVLDDTLWLSAFDTALGKGDRDWLFRLDLSGGAESAEFERVAQGVSAVGVLDGGLVVGQNIKGKDLWRPATFDPTTGESGTLDIGLGKKDTFGRGITVGDGLIAFLDDRKPVVYDPASGTLTRLKLPKRWDLALLTWELHGGEVLTRGGLWVASQGYSGRVSVLPVGNGRAEVDPGCHPRVFNEGLGTCPVIVGSTPGAVWTVTDVDPDTMEIGPLTLRRFDTQTGESTLEVDATDLIDPRVVSLYAEGVS